MKIYDVTRMISEAMVVYKDRESKRIQRKIEAAYAARGVNESAIFMNLHTGTHVDAPLHMLDGGRSIEQMDPLLYCGAAKLFDLSFVEEKIHRAELEKLPIAAGDIVILKTRNSFIEGQYDPHFVYLEEDAASYLVNLGIKTLGIDAMSVERDKPHHPTHSILLGAGIGIVEDLRLKEVPEGHYQFMALPLRITGAEASPVRALLIEGFAELV